MAIVVANRRPQKTKRSTQTEDPRAALGPVAADVGGERSCGRPWLRSGSAQFQTYEDVRT
jgi:hypothetical protein